KEATTITNHQSSCAASKATEIVNIRKMRHQQRVQIVLFEPRSKTTQAASVIHGRSVARRRLRASSYEFMGSSSKPVARSSPQKRSRRSLGRLFGETRLRDW